MLNLIERKPCFGWNDAVDRRPLGGSGEPQRCWLAAENKHREEEEVPTTMAASAELRVDQLPADPLLHILSFLSFRDLIKYVTHF